MAAPPSTPPPLSEHPGFTQAGQAKDLDVSKVHVIHPQAGCERPRDLAPSQSLQRKIRCLSGDVARATPGGPAAA